MWIRTEDGIINIARAREIHAGVPHSGERMAIYADFGTEKIVLAHIDEAAAELCLQALTQAIASGASFFDARALSS